MKAEFTKVQDSGARETFSTGSVRDIQAGKGRFDLIPYEAQRREAVHHEHGSVKYGENNWQKGQPIHVFLNSAMRHLHKYQDGWRDEDHLAAVRWNTGAIMWTEKACKDGVLPMELLDLPWQIAERDNDKTPLDRAAEAFQKDWDKAIIVQAVQEGITGQQRPYTKPPGPQQNPAEEA